MKKIITISMAALVLAACTKGNLEEKGATLIAHSDGTAVKSHLSVESGINLIYWDADDAINVFAKAEGAYQSSKFTTSESGTTVKFNGGDVKLDENCYALFPYDETASFSEASGFTTKVTSLEQNLSNKTFSSAINLAVGKCNSTKEASFRNAGSLMCFTLTQERADTVKYIELKANNGETMAVNGAVSVNWNGGNPTVSVAADAEKSSTITLRPSGETFKTGETYYVWVLPGTYAGGITMTLVSPTGMKAVKAGASSLTAARNQIVPLGEIGGLTYKGSEAEKKSLTFDFSTCPPGWPSGVEGYKSKEPGEKDYPYKLEGADYIFSTAVVTDVETTRSVCWGYNGTAECEMLIIQNERFLGLPAIEGWKLVGIKFAQSLATNSGRKMVITEIVSEKGKQEGVPGGESLAVGTNGEEYSFYLSASKPGKRYYMAPVGKGTGLTSLTLTYEKTE